MDIVERLLSGEDGLEYAAADEIEQLRARMRELEQERDNLIKRENVVYEEACEWRDMHINANMEAKHQRERAEAAEAQVAALRKALKETGDD